MSATARTAEPKERRSIEDLASAELLDWFVWDNLVIAAYERTGGDRRQAMALLARAISRLAEADDQALSGVKSARKFRPHATWA